KYDSISPARPELSAKGKTVLVTGGGTGIGAETAIYFAQADASRIALLGRREQPLLDTKATIEQKYHGVDVLVASTDISKKSQPGIVDTAMNRDAGGIAATGIEDNISLPAGFNIWLASPEARFLNGKFLWTNWDVDELKEQAKELETSSRLSIGLIGWPFDKSDWKFEISW
ncbi:oxidoreductase, partial [Penicillium taxi]|uniref:oxidoreductase n=1 Tax=Penicillium taxi TaxID=168475 RepID=UPI002545023A